MPINESDLPKLRVEVSLLSEFEVIYNPFDWEVGKHGLEIEFTEAGQSGPSSGSEPSVCSKVYRATYLPTVIADQGWSQEKTLEKLCRKSGYHGSFASVADNFILIRRYQSLKFGMNHSDFVII